MNERPVSPTDDINANQHRAASPAASVWVAANAGSGKTHVLTQRVLRLLLSGVAPENLLCLTYTKAAAAEMRRRVATQLGHWALMPEAALRTALASIENAPPNAEKLSRARTLFGHALETPGGLKINTIHAFCESVLHRFPLEADVPFGFSVIEEAAQADLLRVARDEVLADGLQGRGDAAPAVRTLFEVLSDTQIEEAVGHAINKSAELKHVLSDIDGAKSRLRLLVDIKPDETADHFSSQIVNGAVLPPSHYADVFAVSSPKPDGSRFEDKLAQIDVKNPDPDLILKAFLKADQTVPARFPKKDFMQAAGGLGDRILAEAQRLEALCARINAAHLVLRSEALLGVVAAIHKQYEAQKRVRSLLDFDDLIAKLGTLLSAGGSRDWVRYKLDAGITHILVDESQDTNAQQWRVIHALADDFFDGNSAVERPRTLFAVGDKKQSIYSFQGAAPALFSETGTELAIKARHARREWQDVRLKASFRTLPALLDAVDKVFAAPELSAALLSQDDYDGHESARIHQGGSVTLWPPVRQEDMELPADRWPLDKDLLEERNAARVVAERMAFTIKSWIDLERPLAQRGRAVRADDVLILVQSRGPLFQEIIRALKQQQLETPGSDKLPVTSHIAVLDLMALADVLLNPADDLNLAAILRSPLFEIDEDGLYALAADRPKGMSLWQALLQADDDNAIDAAKRLQRWRGRLDFDRPYEFFAQVLYADQGLKRFHARLGTEVDDVLTEFLDLALAHERDAQPSLQGFLTAMRRADISIKRDFEEAGGGVRVMTVHGAKGLEAPIVILADAATGPNVTKMGKPVYIVPKAPGPLFIHASSKEQHVDATRAFRETDVGNQRAEYWRKLYVGMTRAEDELYVTGTLTKKAKLEGTWYQAIETALRDGSAPSPIPQSDDEGLTYPITQPPPKEIGERPGTITAKRSPLDLPPLPKPKTREIIRPSSAYEGDEPVFATQAESIVDAETARKQGIALHALLQHLSRLEQELWPTIALRALEALLPQHPQHHAALAEKAVRILSNPDNTNLFGPDSRAEVPFLANAMRGDASKRIAGRIDRIMIAEDTVWVVDFKSDANPVAADELSSAYLTQLGLYALVGARLFAPFTVRAAIFWTTTEVLMPLPSEAVTHAIKDFTLT